MSTSSRRYHWADYAAPEQIRTGGGTHRCRPTFFIGGAFVFAGWQMAPAVHPAGAAAGAMACGRGLRHLRMALRTLGDFARCGGRVFRWLRPAGVSRLARRDQKRCLWKPRFGQRAAGWQEVSARNFVSEQGPALSPYWMYGKKLSRSYGAKGPATPADTPVVSCPTEKIE